MEADKDGDGKISFDEFCQMVASTVRNPWRVSLIVGRGCQHDTGGCMSFFDLWTGGPVVRIPLCGGMHTIFIQIVVTGSIMLDVNHHLGNCTSSLLEFSTDMHSNAIELYSQAS